MNRLIPITKEEDKPKVIHCKECKHALYINPKRCKYYCLHPDRVSMIYFGEHTCDKGEEK
jgi:hypothetical protein